jgi:hypothetical protein
VAAGFGAGEPSADPYPPLLSLDPAAVSRARPHAPPSSPARVRSQASGEGGEVRVKYRGGGRGGRRGRAWWSLSRRRRRRESSPPPTKSTAGKEAAGSSQAAGKSTHGRGARPPPAPHPTPRRPGGSAAPRRRGGCGGGRGTRTEGSGWNCADEERREKPPVSPRMRLPPSPSAKSRSRCSDRWTMNSATSFFILQIQ